jgi:hypothetical protein
MKTLSILVIAVTLAWPSSAKAADDGQTQPKLSHNGLQWQNTSADIVSTTNGAGNVKGVQCLFTPVVAITIKFYVNGGSAQSVTIDPSYYPADSNGAHFSGWIPYNVRFSSSIRVEMSRGAGSAGDISCAVSWALD